MPISPPVIIENPNVQELQKHPFLVALGERLKTLRSRKGLTRKALSQAASVSERHLANLEYGVGNASILVLLQVSQALESPLSALIGDITTASPEWLIIRSMLEGKDEVTLGKARDAIENVVGIQTGPKLKGGRIALIGLRGAGKSSLGSQLAIKMGFTFVELSKNIESLAGCNTSEIQALYGINAYRRYERRALEAVIEDQHRVIIAAPGGIVSDTGSFKLMLDYCHTVWLKASPEDHMARVMAQGDTRPMAASREAMDDLKGILDGRSAFYSKASHTIDTGVQNFEQTLEQLFHWAQKISTVDD